jgi:hypothetical protein
MMYIHAYGCESEYLYGERVDVLEGRKKLSLVLHPSTPTSGQCLGVRTTSYTPGIDPPHAQASV